MHFLMCVSRSGNEEKMMALLTPLNVNCHASDGRKVLALMIFFFFRIFYHLVIGMYIYYKVLVFSF